MLPFFCGNNLRWARSFPGVIQVFHIADMRHNLLLQLLLPFLYYVKLYQIMNHISSTDMGLVLPFGSVPELSYVKSSLVCANTTIIAHWKKEQQFGLEIICLLFCISYGQFSCLHIFLFESLLCCGRVPCESALVQRKFADYHLHSKIDVITEHVQSAF